jgi:monoamine oxidase
MATQAEVLIVGAGIAGAAAALRLSEAGIKSIVLEAQHRLGGRIQTVHLADGVDIDFGASNVHGYQRSENPTRRMAEKLGIELRVPSPASGYVFSGKGDKKPLDSDYLSKIQKEIGEIMAQKEAEKEDLSLSKRVLEDLRKIAPEAEGLARVAELGAGIRFENISAKYWKTEKGFAGVDALPDGGYITIVKAAFEKSQAKVEMGKEIVQVERSEEGVKLITQDSSLYSAPYV